MPNDFLEKTLEDIIFENKNVIHSYGLPRFKSKSFRQVILPSGKKIDILGFEIIKGYINFDIYELKREIINPDAISQAFGYLDEIVNLINGSFKGWSAEIIMVGKKYDPLSMIKYSTVPIRVYTYDYRLNGINFTEASRNQRYFEPHEAFSLEVWAWGLGRLTFKNGHPSSVNFHNGFEKHLGADFADIIKSERDSHLVEQKLLPAPAIELKQDTPKSIAITTVVFPEQPAWSIEFSKDIPHYNIFEDLGDKDESDFEELEEDYENDMADYEENGDLENEPDLVYYNVEEPTRVHPIVLALKELEAKL